MGGGVGFGEAVAVMDIVAEFFAECGDEGCGDMGDQAGDVSEGCGPIRSRPD